MVLKKKDETNTKIELMKRNHAINMHESRFTHVKSAQNFVKEDKVIQAVDSYGKYLSVLANYYNVPENKLSPQLFNGEKEVTELLLISHAYWTLAKAYDRNPDLQRECIRCLDQFVLFSIGHKFQHVNAQILRKFLLRKMAHNPKFFEDAYKKLQIDNKKCYLATSCYGESHENLIPLRDFKIKISKSSLGLNFIDYYYLISPKIVDFFYEHKKIKFTTETFLIKPFLNLFIFFYKLYAKNF